MVLWQFKVIELRMLTVIWSNVLVFPLIITGLLLASCTSVTVRPVQPSLGMRYLCIQENPQVQVTDFIPVLRNGFDRHGIATEVFSNQKPDKCEFILTYTALRSGNVLPYLSHAELRIEKDGQGIAYAEYPLAGKDGFSLNKWARTREKMDPVIDELLGKRILAIPSSPL